MSVSSGNSETVNTGGTDFPFFPTFFSFGKNIMKLHIREGFTNNVMVSG